MDLQWQDIASSQQLSGLQSQQRQTIDQISGNLVAGLSDANSSGGVFSESTHVGLSAADIHDLDSDDDDDGEAPKPKYGKKTRGRVKVKMEFIKNKLRRYTTFSKRKTGIMKKAYELSTLTGTQVMLLVASETGHVYTFATKKLQPMITSESGKALIQTCLNSPENGTITQHDLDNDRRMNPQGFEETELCYAVGDDDDDPESAAVRDDYYGELSDGDGQMAASFQSSQGAVSSGMGTSNLGNTFNINTIIPPTSNSDGTMSKATSLSLQVPQSTSIIHGVGGMEQLQTRPSVPQHVRYINNNTSNNTANSSHQQQQHQQQDNNNSNSSSNNPHIITTSRGSGGVGSIHQQQTTYSVSIAADNYTTSVPGGDNGGSTVADVVLNDRSAEIQQLERRKDEQQQEITRLQNQLNQQSAAAAAAQAQAQQYQQQQQQQNSSALQLASGGGAQLSGATGTLSQHQLQAGSIPAAAAQHQLMSHHQQQQVTSAASLTTVTGAASAAQLTNQHIAVIPTATAGKSAATLLQVPAAAQAGSAGLLPYQASAGHNQTLVYAAPAQTVGGVHDGLALVNLLPAVSQPNNAYTQIAGTIGGAQANPQQQYITIPISQLTNSNVFQLGEAQPEPEKKT